MKKISTLLLFTLLISANFASAQTVEELQAQKDAKAAELAEKKAQLEAITTEVDDLKSEVAKLKDQITPYPRWNKGVNATLGLSLTEFNDWLGKEQFNTRAINITTTGGAFANGDWENFFWRNNVGLVAGWISFDNKDNPNDSDTLQVAADAINLSSLFGYKFTPKLAASALAEYRSTFIDNFNDPGFLDLGIGATWTPVTDLVVVIHPLNYNFVFSDQEFEYESSLGCKVVADYKRELFKNVGWRSNFSGFLSYEDSDLHNWTWINGLTTAYKGIGIGIELGLRNNKQEALAKNITDNPLQLYYVLGLTYSI